MYRFGNMLVMRFFAIASIVFLGFDSAQALQIQSGVNLSVEKNHYGQVIDFDKFKGEFQVFDNKNFKGKPILSLSKKGLFKGEEQLCQPSRVFAEKWQSKKYVLKKVYSVDEKIPTKNYCGKPDLFKTHPPKFCKNNCIHPPIYSYSTGEESYFVSIEFDFLKGDHFVTNYQGKTYFTKWTKHKVAHQKIHWSNISKKRNFLVIEPDFLKFKKKIGDCLGKKDVECIKYHSKLNKRFENFQNSRHKSQQFDLSEYYLQKLGGWIFKGDYDKATLNRKNNELNERINKMGESENVYKDSLELLNECLDEKHHSAQYFSDDQAAIVHFSKKSKRFSVQINCKFEKWPLATPSNKKKQYKDKIKEWVISEIKTQEL